ncbi:M23 family metallopeptidase [Shewanella abyssi]|uniref:M23 family metallopeptidase n=1 Tax=Shewanella abyssi TaxID=311789 RepID=UPI00200D4DCA|nr:M23 family metallopeptidase [Shewanella abyssi]MCL1050335.1 M23 family metallopeptidase [Shewanella abyssi]
MFTSAYVIFSFVFSVLPASADVDWSLAPDPPERRTTHMGGANGVQSITFINPTNYPIVAVYNVQDKFLLESNEVTFYPSPVKVPAQTTILAASYLAKEGIKQTGIGFITATSFANNTSNIPLSPYIIPIKKEALVMQAPNKDHFKFWMQKLTSHKGIKKNAVDFDVPIGTAIYTMAAGKVVSVYEGSNFGCPGIECVPYGNQVEILHKDGSIGSYSHIRQHGVVVDLDDYVSAGQLIAYSGDTGGGGEPHLHVEVHAWQYDDEGSTHLSTLPLTFNDNDGKVLQISEGDYINASSTFGKLINLITAKR